MGPAKILPVFLLGESPSPKMGGEAGYEAEIDGIIERFGLETGSKVVVRNEDDLLGVNLNGVDGLVVFPHCESRFSPLIYVAESGSPILIASEEETFCNALNTYEYLADHGNVEVAFGEDEVKRKVRAIEAAAWVERAKTCLFDSGDWKVEGIAWMKNPIVSGMLKTEPVDLGRFFELYEGADAEEAEGLAGRWMGESEVLEPSFEDVVKSARLYMAMKAAIEEMGADAAYVLWCGQFTKRLGTKMCFALAKLSDDGIPVGCWRGENLLPLLVLHAASERPVFVCEAFTHSGKTISLRHCFAPGVISSDGYRLKRWRDMEGTVTGYVRLPEGEATLVNCGIGDRMVVARGRVVDCRDLGGENCRMTIWVELEDSESVHDFVGREFAMVYGDYAEEACEIGERLGLMVL